MNDSLQIKPHLEVAADCHGCGTRLAPRGLLWQGIHVCAEFRCPQCAAEFHEDLPIGHAASLPCRVDAAHRLLRADPAKASWFGEPLRRALERPDASPVQVEVRVRRGATRVVILNCLDFLSGHCLLKLLNAARHLRDPGWGLVVIVPRFLAWMVPEDAAEVWVVDLPLDRAQRYFPDLHRRICAELERFSEVRLSRAYSHPAEWNPRLFTGVPRHDFTAPSFRATFVWRNDRLWLPERGWSASLAGVSPARVRQALQRRRIADLLDRLRREFPGAKPTVAGVGRDGDFPSWIDDQRTDRAGEANAERELCRIYSESRLVIGVHGSNMLLASGHAGMCIDLMPEERWGNVAQDMLFASDEPADADLRLSAFRRRFIDVGAPPRLVAAIAILALRHHARAERSFVREMA